ncbi:hypothetical protein [Acaryochloris sp. CCMEE 5410]|uniref:hypothetical protein n=1 Tax=Acaryochloris sp. CCMEE 5410 TaxID=310037 RepID=UPI000248506B|nr:hypothetical protein [Acaryochloris sp. CCMEE 5410]KAI9129459.1 hypothetical protein ON05_035745 [Acaryochloris sp. CCMEE 5410]
MQTAIQKIGDTSLLVTPDGKPIPHKDAEQPTLHIMPKLYIPYSDIGLGNITLFGASVLPFGKNGEQGKDFINILPEDVRLTHPVPNIRFVIAGTSDRRMGWEIPIDPNRPPQQIQLLWWVETSTEDRIIEHYFDLEFELTQQGNVFSMASLNFAVGEEPRAVSFIDPRDVSEASTRNDPSYQIGYLDDRVIIRQSNQIRSCAWSDLGLEEFENAVYLRDTEPVATFKTHLEEFASDACIEMPAHVLKEAISRAKTIADSQEEFWFGEKQYEHCPGLQHICQWWNNNAPNPEYRRAVNIYLWVRVEDDSEYWAGWYECPNIEIGTLSPDRCAKVGQHIIVEFLQGHGSYTPIGRNGFMVWGVDGEPFWDVGAPLDQADEAYYGHGMLKGFSERFPMAWEQLQSFGVNSAYQDVSKLNFNILEVPDLDDLDESSYIQQPND